MSRMGLDQREGEEKLKNRKAPSHYILKENAPAL